MRSIARDGISVHHRRFFGASVLAIILTMLAICTYVYTAERDRTFTMEFAHGDQLADGSDIVRNDIISLLKAYPDMMVRVTVHVESESDAKSGVSLSVARANKVRDMLIASGVAAERIRAVGVNRTPTSSKIETNVAFSRRLSTADIHIGKFVNISSPFQ